MHKLIALFFIFVLFAQSNKISAQCDNAFINTCSTSGGEAKYIKHFRIRFAEAPNIKKRSQGTFTLMLMKGNHYRFLICNDPSKPGATIMELSNDFSQYGSNYNAQTDTEYRAFDFICSKTGPYYIKMFFKDGKEGCGVCVLTLVTD
ncbi:MAG: hypothetical protein PF517_09710 [Salinivirgaceae bacterium]|jgi:hypothetical protein|nr:hypothetical protein [Salinivirgaceae bacterium]